VQNHAPPLTEGALPNEKDWAQLEKEKERWLGRQLTLWATGRHSNFYKDQFGVKHHAHVVEEEIRIKIIEVRLVPGVWKQTNWYAGFKAVEVDFPSGEEKKRTFFCNWKSYDENSMTPISRWSTGTSVYWHATTEFEHGWQKPILTKSGKRAVPIGETECPTHPDNLLRGNGLCFECEVERLREE
jgi:hypothetical protein